MRDAILNIRHMEQRTRNELGKNWERTKKKTYGRNWGRNWSGTVKRMGQNHNEWNKLGMQ